jgi:polysaccharide export outer membrane protein
MLRVASRLFIVISLGWAMPLCHALQESYRVGKSDVIRIEIPNEPDFSRDSVTVTENGTIPFPYVGDLKVEGLTLSEIAALIRRALVEQKLLTQPSISVTVREYHSQSVTILGEVKSTGKYYLRGAEKLVDKIAEAGGLNANAGDITISRTGAGGNRVITIKASSLLSDATILQGGDVILIRPKELAQVFVSGEVVSAKPITYTEGLTVSQAILIAGGVNRFGSKSKVNLKRIVDGKETILRINLSDIDKGKAKDVPLLPNDTVIVGKRIF